MGTGQSVFNAHGFLIHLDNMPSILPGSSHFLRQQGCDEFEGKRGRSISDPVSCRAETTTTPLPPRSRRSKHFSEPFISG